MTTLKDWSSTTNYPAGIQPWSGTPTKVEPSLASAQAGIAPDQQVPAQWFNWLFSKASLCEDAILKTGGTFTLSAPLVINGNTVEFSQIAGIPVFTGTLANFKGIVACERALQFVNGGRLRHNRKLGADANTDYFVGDASLVVVKAGTLTAQRTYTLRITAGLYGAPADGDSIIIKNADTSFRVVVQDEGLPTSVSLGTSGGGTITWAEAVFTNNGVTPRWEFVRTG